MDEFTADSCQLAMRISPRIPMFIRFFMSTCYSGLHFYMLLRYTRLRGKRTRLSSLCKTAIGQCSHGRLSESFCPTRTHAHTHTHTHTHARTHACTHARTHLAVSCVVTLSGCRCDLSPCLSASLPRCLAVCRWRGVLANVLWVSADEGGDEIYTYSVRLDSLRNLGVSLTVFSVSNRLETEEATAWLEREEQRGRQRDREAERQAGRGSHCVGCFRSL